MDRSIAQYQKAFNDILEKLKSNDHVLAVMVFGSMVTGDLWEESDIDIFVIMGKAPFQIKNIYTEENGIEIHIKLMSKEKFLQLHESDLRGGFIHRIFASSRLVFSKDLEVTTKYNNGRYYPDVDKERWNLVYLGNVIKNIGLCKKYIANDSIYTAYSLCVRCIEEYAKLYVNSSGYMISKDAMSMAMDMSDDFKDCVEKLFFKSEHSGESLQGTVSFIQNSVNKNLKSYISLLLNFMKDRDGFLSAEDIRIDDLFNCFDIDFEEILNYLFKSNIVKKEKRDYKDNVGVELIKENVYFV
jgi:predicted nucleotidyltransferase